MKLDLGSYIELYITNECNLTCSNCNRFNNYDFRGHYSWAQSRDAILAWSQRITASMITIIGGEPTLHPELEQWVRGTAEAWPDRPVVVQTNGLRPLWSQRWWRQLVRDHANVGTGVAIHDHRFRSRFEQTWGPDNTRGQFDATEFSDCALRPQGDHFAVYDSDPQQAWQCCTMRRSHTILDGRLYQCPVMAVLPRFQQQYHVVMTDQQQELLNSYQSLAPDCDDQQLTEFAKHKDMAMPQCALCPGQYQESTVTFDGQRKQWPPRRVP